MDGTVDPRFAPVQTAFAEILAGGAGTGASLAVWHEGAWVVDLWGGYADAARTRPWTRDTLVMPYSVTKPFAAACVLRLVDRGQLELDAPVAWIWPEFQAHATVRQLLSHQGGVVAIDAALPPDALFDQDRMAAALAAQTPWWPPGTGHGEAALVYGNLLGELVRRVDGRSLGTFLREEIGDPLGIDFHVGLRPSEMERTADLTGFSQAFLDGLDEDGSQISRAMGNPPGALEREVVNSPAWRDAEIAAVNGHGTARAVVAFYVALIEGRVLSAPLVEEMTRPQVSGHDRVLGSDATWGLGVGVDEDGFGMGGLGGSIGWWSRAGRYGFAYLTGWIGDHEPGERLENAVREILGLAPI
jgi:CubicO group peptidase (beta-lactamase class C family)